MKYSICLVLTLLLTFDLAGDPGLVTDAPVVEWQAVPRTRDFSSGPRLQLRIPGADAAFRQNFPTTAPTDFQKARELSFPDANTIFGLAFGPYEGKPGWYTGPDGGRIYQWKKDNWVWERVDGAKITRWENGTSAIEANGHRFLQYPNQRWPGTIEWTFPDKTRLTRHPWPSENTVWFVYDRPDPSGRITFHIYQKGKWAPNETLYDNYKFNYTNSWADHIQAFREWNKKDEFFATAERLLGFKNPGQIPVIMFDQLADMRKQLSNPSQGEGGAGGLLGISMCCGSKRQPPSGNPVIAKLQRQLDSFSLILHETAHNLQQHRCFYVRAGQSDLPPEQYPTPWFVEGIAEFAMMRALPRDRARKYKELYAALDSGKIPAANQIGYADGSVYMFGTAMVEATYLQKGAEPIRKFYDDMCLGTTEDASLRKNLGMDLPGLLDSSLTYFRTNRNRIEEEIKTLEMEGLPQIKLAASKSCSFEPGPLPGTVKDIRDIPDIWNTCRMDTAKLTGFTGSLRGPGGERVMVWSVGDQTVETGRIKFTYWKSDAAEASFDGHKIMQWKNGERRWTLPNNSLAVIRSNGKIEYFDTEGKSIQP
ncbi:MAG: hypothetical protein JNM27_04305 [Leptospirales bacterium]|nr:hypothetical protein [Leptospirales bacterium]